MLLTSVVWVNVSIDQYGKPMVHAPQCHDMLPPANKLIIFYQDAKKYENAFFLNGLSSPLFQFYQKFGLLEYL